MPSKIQQAITKCQAIVSYIIEYIIKIHKFIAIKIFLKDMKGYQSILFVGVFAVLWLTVRPAQTPAFSGHLQLIALTLSSSESKCCYSWESLNYNLDSSLSTA